MTERKIVMSHFEIFAVYVVHLSYKRSRLH